MTPNSELKTFATTVAIVTVIVWVRVVVCTLQVVEIFILLFSTIGDIKPSDEASLSVTCSSNTNVSVAWNAPVGAVVNLGYTCYWAENNTQVSCIADF